MDISPDKLRAALASGLPGIEAHRRIYDYPRDTVEQVLASGRAVKRSSVVALLYPTGTATELVLLKRHDYKGVHSGQIGLPGGRLEEGETELDAALRETLEETGAKLRPEEVIGALTPLFIPPSNFIVQPFLARLPSEPDWKWEEAEVRFPIHVPLLSLLDEDCWRVETVPMSGDRSPISVRAFVFDGHVIWGATAMMLSELRLLIEKTYI